MAVGDGLLAVGSQSHASLVDPRCQAPVQDVASLDTDHGASTRRGCMPVRLGATDAGGACSVVMGWHYNFTCAARGSAPQCAYYAW
jgi:hypothetical protein